MRTDTVIQASDRRYVVDRHGSLRVESYTPGASEIYQPKTPKKSK